MEIETEKEKHKTMGKRFWFGVWAITCISITSIILKYTGDIYWKLVLAITTIYVSGQTLTDFKNGGGGKV